VNASGYIGKGEPITAHSEIDKTTTSAVIDCRGYNAVLVAIIISVATKNWTVKLQGAMTRGGTYMDLYEQANTGTMTAMSYQTNANKMVLFKGVPDFIKVVATEDEDTGKCTVIVKPINM
jgi:hypothetical protein